jgi:hypothetical protein
MAPPQILFNRLETRHGWVGSDSAKTRLSRPTCSAGSNAGAPQSGVYWSSFVLRYSPTNPGPILCHRPRTGRSYGNRLSFQQPVVLQNSSTATQSLVSKKNAIIYVRVQAIEQPNPVEPNPDPSSPVLSLSWLLEDGADDEDRPSEHRTTTVVPSATTVEQGLPPRPPGPSTNIHSLFPPFPPPSPGPQVRAVLGVAKSVYDAQNPGVRRDRIPLIVRHAFRQSCHEYRLVDGLRHLDGRCERLKPGFVERDVFYEDIKTTQIRRPSFFLHHLGFSFHESIGWP